MADAGVVRELEDVLSAYEGLSDARVEPIEGGLINATYRVRAGPRQWVLQRVNPIFSPHIHENIRAVTEHLSALGLVTPRLLLTRDGRPYVSSGDDGVWRVMSFIEGAGFDVVQSRGQARAAGELVGRFHAALDTLKHDFVDMRVGVHDTAAHLHRLERAVAEASGHRLHARVSALADEILAAAQGLEAMPALPDRVCHGDLKLNNVRFEGTSERDRERARCLIDLDTVGPMHLGYEMGDALRSWCNPGGEDQGQVHFDLEICAAALDGYAAGTGRAPRHEEAQALFLGVEWVSLELSCRFAADALLERYFGWDATRFPGRGEHNLARAEGQWALYRAVVATRAQRARQLGLGRV